MICTDHRQLGVTTHFCSYYKKRVPCHISCFPSQQDYNFACRYWIVWLCSMALRALMQPRASQHWSLHLSLPPCLSASTQATTLFSRQSTLEDLDGMPECIPKTSERARPKLRKMYSMDMSNSSMDSGSSFVSRCLVPLCPPPFHSHQHEHSDCMLCSFMRNMDLFFSPHPLPFCWLHATKKPEVLKGITVCNSSFCSKSDMKNIAVA